MLRRFSRHVSSEPTSSSLDPSRVYRDFSLKSGAHDSSRGVNKHGISMPSDAEQRRDYTVSPATTSRRLPGPALYGTATDREVEGVPSVPCIHGKHRLSYLLHRLGANPSGKARTRKPSSSSSSSHRPTEERPISLSRASGTQSWLSLPRLPRCSFRGPGTTTLTQHTIACRQRYTG